ncbi:MAG: hypothetical protein OXR62_03425 [Ahrensia sp.]|nr:hypothetical protein [Ahrensia sp.]
MPIVIGSFTSSQPITMFLPKIQAFPAIRIRMGKAVRHIVLWFVCVALMAPVTAHAFEFNVDRFDLQQMYCAECIATAESLDANPVPDNFPDLQQTGSDHCLVHSVALLPGCDDHTIFAVPDSVLSARNDGKLMLRLYPTERPPRLPG